MNNNEVHYIRLFIEFSAYFCEINIKEKQTIEKTYRTNDLFFQINNRMCQYLDESNFLENYYDSDNDTDTVDVSSTTIDPYIAYCESLEQGAEILTLEHTGEKYIGMHHCCKIPRFDDALNHDLYLECEEEGKRTNITFKYDEDGNYYAYCCQIITTLTEGGFLKFSTDPNVKPETDVRRLISIMEMAAKDKLEWVPVVTNSAKRCYDDCFGLEAAYGYSCLVVPNILETITMCSEKENFLKCPEKYWNPDKLSMCTEKRKYVEECLFINGRFF
jgi:hypothetical protein